MSADNSIMQIRETIKCAEAQPNYVESLRALLAEQIPQLHQSIQLPRDNPEDALLDFVIRYIEHVPNVIDAVRELTQQAGIYDQVSKFLEMAEGFFTQPPKLITEREGLDALMDEAYLAHRLLEEINDRVLIRCGFPLTPMDMTRANIIVHQLIGEPFANRLDFMVLYAIEQYMDKSEPLDNPTLQRYIETHRKNGWETELKRWPCLAENLSINLSLTPRTRKNLH